MVIDAFSSSRRRNCTMPPYARCTIAVLVVVVFSRSSIMQPQRAQCFTHTSMSRSADRALPPLHLPLPSASLLVQFHHTQSSECALPAGALDDLGTSRSCSIPFIPSIPQFYHIHTSLIRVAYLITMPRCLSRCLAFFSSPWCTIASPCRPNCTLHF